MSFATSCGQQAKAPEPENGPEKPAVTPEDYIVRETGAFPLYPDPGVGNDYVECIAMCNLYDSLVFPGLDGSINPSLATDWQVSEDGLKYTFHLRPGVKFHDGSEVEAEDVVFSMKRLLTMGEGFAYLFVDHLKDVQAKDKSTVEFTLKKPFGPFVAALVRLYILNKDLVMQHLEKPGQYGDFGDYGKKWLLTNDAGSGPYKIKEMKLEEYLLMEKFDDYWGGWEAGAPKYYKVIGTTEPVTVRTMMQRRELEITDMWQPLENLEAMKQIPGVEMALLFNGSICNVMLNTKKPPTDDVHFRRALAYCFDYDAVVNNIYKGSKQSRGPVPFMFPGHDASIQPYTRNLEKAKEELKQSKYADKLDKYPVTLSWCAEVPEEEKLALLLQANAAELGIKVDVQKTPWGSMIAEAQRVDTTPNGTIIFVSASYAEAGSILKARYHSSSCGTWEQCEWLQDKEIDNLIDKALSTTDREQRFALYHEIQKKLVDLSPTLWLFDQAEMRAY
ncbi:MAG TPA: ABC transporter substrate-binding protein, partial [Firmicutes bacterium]|nr:ABC transporter substrate-binding protein [Bacillota bacterium]